MTDELNSILKAGKIAAQARELAIKLCVPGAKILDIAKQVDTFLWENADQPAFPAQFNFNSTAAHFCPTEDENPTVEKEDVIKIDVGACVNGKIGDTAATVYHGNDPKLKALVQASKDALNAACNIIKPGIKLYEIGNAIQTAIENYGLSPVKNLSGHGLGDFKIHTAPQFPNYDNNDQTEIKNGMHFAIEPFATNGKGLIHESTNPTIFCFIQKRPVRSQFARDALKIIQNYNGLPFAKWWLDEKMGKNKASFAIRELLRAGIIQDYPSLPEVAKGNVSQHEHTFYIEDDKVYITTKLEE